MYVGNKDFTLYVTDIIFVTYFRWVKNNTNGKLDQFLKQPLSPLTKAVLLSALYFSGQWAQPFIPELTRP